MAPESDDDVCEGVGTKEIGTKVDTASCKGNSNSHGNQADTSTAPALSIPKEKAESTSHGKETSGSDTVIGKSTTAPQDAMTVSGGIHTQDHLPNAAKAQKVSHSSKAHAAQAVKSETRDALVPPASASSGAPKGSSRKIAKATKPS